MEGGRAAVTAHQTPTHAAQYTRVHIVVFLVLHIVIMNWFLKFLALRNILERPAPPLRGGHVHRCEILQLFPRETLLINFSRADVQKCNEAEDSPLVPLLPLRNFAAQYTRFHNLVGKSFQNGDLHIQIQATILCRP